MKQYWCFICQKKIIKDKSTGKNQTNNNKSIDKQIITQCPYCHQQAFQQIQKQNESQPQKFDIPIINNKVQNSNNQNILTPNAFNNMNRNNNNINGNNNNMNGSNIYNSPLNFMQFTNQMFGFLNPNNFNYQNNQNNMIYNNANSQQYVQLPRFFNRNAPPLMMNLLQFNNMIQMTQNWIDNIVQQMIQRGQTVNKATPQQLSKLQLINKVSQCSICQSENQNSGYKLKCNHQFHKDCINPWFQRTNTCPVCRKNLQ